MHEYYVHVRKIHAYIRIYLQTCIYLYNEALLDKYHGKMKFVLNLFRGLNVILL